MSDWWQETLDALRRGEAIERPPCWKCRNWRPQVSRARHPADDGFRLCDSLDPQYQDFSCFEEKV